MLHTKQRPAIILACSQLSVEALIIQVSKVVASPLLTNLSSHFQLIFSHLWASYQIQQVISAKIQVYLLAQFYVQQAIFSSEPAISGSLPAISELVVSYLWASYQLSLSSSERLPAISLPFLSPFYTKPEFFNF